MHASGAASRSGTKCGSGTNRVTSKSQTAAGNDDVVDYTATAVCSFELLKEAEHFLLFEKIPSNGFGVSMKRG